MSFSAILWGSLVSAQRSFDCRKLVSIRLNFRVCGHAIRHSFKEVLTTNYLFQFARILAFCFLGEVCHAVLPLPIPASIYGLLLLLAALHFGLVKLDQVKEVGLFLTGIFPLLFVPAAAGVMELWAEMGDMLLPILIAIIPVTVLVLVSAGRTTQALTQRKQAKEANHD